MEVTRAMGVHLQDPARQQRLPTELAEACIDCLSDDGKTLYACAQVCHAWLPRSYSHRFRSIDYGQDARSNGLTIHKATSLVLLLDYLAGNRRVCAFVLQLRIRARREKPQLNMLQRFFAILPRLIACDIDATISNSLTSSFTFSVRSFRPITLRTLTLRNPNRSTSTGMTRSHAQLSEILELLSEIDELHLFSQGSYPTLHGDSATRTPRISAQKLRVHRLTLDGNSPGTTAAAFNQLHHLLDPHALRAVRCPMFGLQEDAATAFEIFLQDVSPELTELGSTNSALEYTHPPSSLSHCSNLQSLHLSASIHLRQESLESGGGWDACCEIVKSAPRSVYKLTLVVDMIAEETTNEIRAREVLVALHSLDWSIIDRFLLGGNERLSQRRLDLALVDKGFEPKQVFLLVTKQLVEAKLSERVRHLVDYQLTHTVAT